MTALPVLVILVLSWNSLNVAQKKSTETPTTTTTQASTETNSPLLETGTTTTVAQPLPSGSEMKILSYNIRWRGGEELEKLIKLFREDPAIGHATFLCLQEVDRNKKRTSQKNTASQIAHELDLHYAWTAPPTANPKDEEETGVAILSRFPLAQITRIVLPNEGPGRRRRVALGATIDVGGTKLRIYSVHSETRIALSKKLEQMDAVIKDLNGFPRDMPAAIVGDFNTWDPDAGPKTIELFTRAGFQTPPFNNESTFSRHILFVPLELKLDWIWLRGLQPVAYGVGKNISISDHFPVWTSFKKISTN